MRLTSFLTRIENVFQTGAPAGKDESLVTFRTINYHSKLARLVIGTRREAESRKTRGAIILQAFHLADGAPCVKASLYWSEPTGDPATVHSVFPKDDTDWEAEARRVAETWLAGPPISQAGPLSAAAEPLAAAV